MSINPTPQLKVFNISLSEILFFLSHEKIFWTFILFKFIFAVFPTGITLDKLSSIPPPVICAQLFTSFKLINFVNSCT